MNIQEKYNICKMKINIKKEKRKFAVIIQRKEEYDEIYYLNPFTCNWGSYDYAFSGHLHNVLDNKLRRRQEPNYRTNPEKWLIWCMENLKCDFDLAELQLRAKQQRGVCGIEDKENG